MPRHGLHVHSIIEMKRSVCNYLGKLHCRASSKKVLSLSCVSINHLYYTQSWVKHNKNIKSAVWTCTRCNKKVNHISVMGGLYPAMCEVGLWMMIDISVGNCSVIVL